MNYNEFKTTNNYLREISKKNNKKFMSIRVDSIDVGNNSCVIDFSKTNKENYPINYIIDGVLKGYFYLVNPSIFANFNFNKYKSFISNKNKKGINLKSLKSRHSASFYYKNDYININCISDKVLTKPSLNQCGDYGEGFYCYYEEDIKRSKVYDLEGKYVNKYILKTSNLKILDLRDYDVTYWISIISANKTYWNDNISMKFFLEKYNIHIECYDCVYGYIPDETSLWLINDFIEGKKDDANIKCIIRDNCLDLGFILTSESAIKNIEFKGYIRNKYIARDRNYTVRSDLTGTFINKYIVG